MTAITTQDYNAIDRAVSMAKMGTDTPAGLARIYEAREHAIDMIKAGLISVQEGVDLLIKL